LLYNPSLLISLIYRIQHEVVSGLKYLQIVKRKGIRVDKTEEMIGSYGPNPTPEPYEKKVRNCILFG
jgi:hypothetical protein